MAPKIFIGINECERNGDIRLMGLNFTWSIAGRVDLCYEKEWRAVCQGMWNVEEAEVVCRQLGLSVESKYPKIIKHRKLICQIQELFPA